MFPYTYIDICLIFFCSQGALWIRPRILCWPFVDQRCETLFGRQASRQLLCNFRQQQLLILSESHKAIHHTGSPALPAPFSWGENSWRALEIDCQMAPFRRCCPRCNRRTCNTHTHTVSRPRLLCIAAAEIELSLAAEWAVLHGKLHGIWQPHPFSGSSVSFFFIFTSLFFLCHCEFASATAPPLHFGYNANGASKTRLLCFDRDRWFEDEVMNYRTLTLLAARWYNPKILISVRALSII